MYSDEGDEVRIDSDDSVSQASAADTHEASAAGAPADDAQSSAQAERASGAQAASGDSAESAAADSAENAAADQSAQPASDENAESAEKSSDGSLTPLGQAKKEAADYLAALQRERADFINYRNRSEKERKQYREFGVQDVLTALLPALDDLDRIAENGKMTDDLQAVQKQLDRAFSKFDVTKFGAKGEEFDPTKHEAILHRQSADVTTPSVDAVVESGYKIGGRVIRAARVVVVSPVETTDSAEQADASAAGAQQESDAAAGKADSSATA